MNRKEMSDKEFDQLQDALQAVHKTMEKLQDAYKFQTGKRWMPELKLDPPTCEFCGGEYFHTNNLCKGI